MKKEDWAVSQNAQEMLETIHQERPNFLRTQIAQLHKYLIACCWKHKHLIPQSHLRNGLEGAERWLAGEISDDQLNELNWYAEAEAFALDYAETPEELAELHALFAGIEELQGMPFAEARQLMRDAAYFAEGSMIYSKFRKLPWVGYLLSSRFLCADLLREFLQPEF